MEFPIICADTKLLDVKLSCFSQAKGGFKQQVAAQNNECNNCTIFIRL